MNIGQDTNIGLWLPNIYLIIIVDKYKKKEYILGMGHPPPGGWI
jgi:hypothetical protein